MVYGTPTGPPVGCGIVELYAIADLCSGVILLGPTMVPKGNLFARPSERTSSFWGQNAPSQGACIIELQARGGWVGGPSISDILGRRVNKLFTWGPLLGRSFSWPQKPHGHFRINTEVYMRRWGEGRVV